ncbi:YtxH domain-containing protein [Cupriavidus gilardii]|uniref:YtxH domain-containing protein n=1 Tax=Cupriavidus gilardii TaxID=82541 RepID=UPI001ABE1C77|nr:YtxH domain-containing protein [Cupriavidus gilardii]MBO4122558.1 YtxH domain-containing protein [Cupriavidus gilardii]
MNDGMHEDLRESMQRETRGGMPSLMQCVVAAAVGAAIMYLFDPQSGRRRRALLRDKAEASRHDMQDLAEKQAKRITDRMQGIAAKVRNATGLARRTADDDTIAERVRAELGRLVGHPGAVDVAVVGGRVWLSGHILASEHEALLAAVRGVTGVQDVDDRLTVHEEAGNVPELQS